MYWEKFSSLNCVCDTQVIFQICVMASFAAGVNQVLREEGTKLEENDVK
jgi:hypothetical protein